MTTISNVEKIERLANEIVTEAKRVEAKFEIDTRKDIDFGIEVEVRRATYKGVQKIFGIIYDFTKDKSTIWVETKDDIYKVKAEEVKVKKDNPQPKKGFNKNKTKLTETAVKDIFLMATTSKLTHKQIVGWVKLHHGIEIVPKTVSDIKLGKRWAKLGLVKGV